MDLLFWIFVTLSFLCGAGMVFFVWKKFCPSDNVFLRPIPPDPDFLKDLKEEELIKRDLNSFRLKSKYDTIIIGSGNSGLSCGSLLSQEGKSVLVLEQSETLGGMGSTFKEDGFEFPTGLHILTKVDNEDLPNGSFWRCLYDKVSEKRLEFVDADDEIFQTYHDGTLYRLPYGRENYEKYLCEKFPEKSQEIKNYVGLCYKVIDERPVVTVVKILPSFLKRPFKWVLEHILGYQWYKLEQESIYDYLQRHFGDTPALYQILSLVPGCGGSLKVLSTQVAMFLSAAFNIGLSRIVGGSSMLAKTMSRVIVKYGGDVACNARVTKILLNESKTKVIGVEVQKSKPLKHEPPIQILCENCVSTAGVFNTYSFLPKDIRPQCLDEYKPSTSHFFVFMGLDCPPEDVDLLGCTNFKPSPEIIDQLIEKDSSLQHNKEEKERLKEMNFNCISGEKYGKPTLVFLCECSYEIFKKWEHTKLKQRGNDYENLKQKWIDAIIDEFCERFPKLKDHIAYVSGGTPLSTRYWTGWSFGESYGIACNKDRTILMEKLIQQKKIKGLFFSGTDVGLSCGVPVAILMGVSTFGKVLGRKSIPELGFAAGIRKKMNNRVKKNQ